MRHRFIRVWLRHSGLPPCPQWLPRRADPRISRSTESLRPREGVKPDERERATRCDLCRQAEQRPLRRNRRCAALLQSPLTDSNRRPPPYHAVRIATGCNPRQRFGLVLAVSRLSRFAVDCHRLQPRGSIKAPSYVVGFGDGCIAGRLARSAAMLREERQSPTHDRTDR